MTTLTNRIQSLETSVQSILDILNKRQEVISSLTNVVDNTSNQSVNTEPVANDDTEPVVEPSATHEETPSATEQVISTDNEQPNETTIEPSTTNVANTPDAQPLASSTASLDVLTNDETLVSYLSQLNIQHETELIALYTVYLNGFTLTDNDYHLVAKTLEFISEHSAFLCNLLGRRSMLKSAVIKIAQWLLTKNVPEQSIPKNVESLILVYLNIKRHNYKFSAFRSNSLLNLIP